MCDPAPEFKDIDFGPPCVGGILYQSIIKCIQNGLQLQYPFKVKNNDWFGEVKIFTSFNNEFVVYTGFGNERFSNLIEAVNFFGTLVYNKHNLSWFYKSIEKNKLGGIQDIEDMEYIKQEQYDAMFEEYTKKFFEQECPQSKEFNCQKAIDFIEMLKKEEPI